MLNKQRDGDATDWWLQQPSNGPVFSIWLVNSLCFSSARLVTEVWYITAELGRALAVVKVTLQVNGNSQFLGVRPPKTIGVIKIKSGTNDYVGEGNPHAKFGNIPVTGGFSPYRWNITFRFVPITFFFFNVMLIFEQGYRWDRWTDFNAQYLITRVSAGSAYLWGLK